MTVFWDVTDAFCLVTNISRGIATCTFRQEVVTSVEKSVCNMGSEHWDRAISNPMGAVSEMGG
jgi:hypothetical protein